ncbi:MAG: hypothetical protein EOO99_11980 [Pedobacter sp.]|nr:MAG: hypothetical protein EOO99_11980 [Pedobacter sp.]
MDLKKYKENIRNQLLNGVRAQMKKDEMMAQGNFKSTSKMTLPKQKPVLTDINFEPDYYGEDFSDNDAIAERFSDIKITKPRGVKKPLINKRLAMKERELSTPKVPTVIMGGSIECDDDDDCEIVGGKFNFVKSISKFGKDMGKTINNEVIKQGSKEIVKSGMNFAKDGIKNFMKVAPEAEAEAPMMLMAAGVKKKRTRKMGQRELNRQKLIREIMIKYSVTLPEASKLIKENNLSY